MKNTQKNEYKEQFVGLLESLVGHRQLDWDKVDRMFQQISDLGFLITRATDTDDEEELVFIGEKLKRCQSESREVAIDFFDQYGISFEDVQEKIARSLDEKQIDVFNSFNEKMKSIERSINRGENPKMNFKKRNKGRKRGEKV